MATIPNGQKILTSAPEVNTTYGGPASLQTLNTWYTMEDISSTVMPYKVFTALLTQSGGDDELFIEDFLTAGTQNIVKGTSYSIDINSDNVDFSSIGAPSNAEETNFIATMDKLNSDFPNVTWSLKYNTGTPTVTVLENTIGNIWFTYKEEGQYIVNSTNAFTNEKTWQLIENSGSGGSVIGSILYVNSNTIWIYSFDGGIQNDNILSNTPIEIRVYN